MAEKTTTTTTKRSKDTKNFPISDSERHELISALALKKAQARNFTNGTPEQDWLEAEKEIDAKHRFVK